MYFVLKERGLYSFFATLSILSITSTEAIFDFRKNDESLAYIKTDAHGVQNENDKASGTVNLELGYRVYIICMHSYYTGTLVGAAQYSYFFGLIYTRIHFQLTYLCLHLKSNSKDNSACFGSKEDAEYRKKVTDL